MLSYLEQSPLAKAATSLEREYREFALKNTEYPEQGGVLRGQLMIAFTVWGGQDTELL